MIIVGVLTDLVNFRSVAVYIALITEICAVVIDNRNSHDVAQPTLLTQPNFGVKITYTIDNLQICKQRKNKRKNKRKKKKE